MATMSALKDAKDALDAGLVSQAEFDHLKRKYLRAKEEAFEFQKRESEAKLRAFALESIVKHGSSIMSEEQKVGLVRDYAKMSGLDPSTTEKAGPSSKRQRIKAEQEDVAPQKPSTPPLALLPPADAPARAAPDQVPAPTSRRTPAAGAGTRRSGVVIDEQIFQYKKWNFILYLEDNADIITEDWLDAALPLMKSKSDIDTTDKIRYLFRAAARGGYVRIFADHATGVFQELLDAETCSNAAKGGHLDVLKWLRSQDPPCPWSEATCAEAASNGQLDVVKWLRSQNPPCPWNEWTTYFAAENGHFDVLKWLHSQNPPCPWNERTTYFAEDNDHFDVLKWLVENGCPYTPKLAADRLEELGLA